MREYWIVAPADRTVIVHVLDEEGTFTTGVRYGVADRVASAAVDGVEVDLATALRG